MFINERKRKANTYLIGNFDSLEAAPSNLPRPRQLPSLPRPKFSPAYSHDPTGQQTTVDAVPVSCQEYTRTSTQTTMSPCESLSSP